MADEPAVDHFGVAGEVSGDAIAGALEAAGVFTTFIDNAVRMGSGGVDEAESAGFRDDEEGDVVVESNDSDAGTAGSGLIDELIVVEPGADGHLFSRHKGANDSLGGLLGEAESFDLETGIAEDGGDEISAGDFTGAGSFAGAVEIPWSAEPTAHHFGEGCFEGDLALGDDIGDFPGGAGLGVAGGEIGALLIKPGNELLVAGGIWLFSDFLRSFFGEVFLVK